MTGSNSDAEPLVFKELPKEQQKALDKEFSEFFKTTKAARNLIIFAVIWAALLITIAIVVVVHNRNSIGTYTPAFIAPYLPIFLAHRQGKFAQWLKDEKNIVMKRDKRKS
ncbi:MAG: hypothetical protein LBB75_05545 [Oscillospiraceae bacterium]|jgi:hypothetical protein|nr:hypothetical protein [Oscillospiraceae bacterium]